MLSKLAISYLLQASAALDTGRRERWEGMVFQNVRQNTRPLADIWPI